MDAGIDDATWLREAYSTRSSQSIADELSVSRGTVDNRLKRFGGILPHGRWDLTRGRPKTAEHKAKNAAAKRAYWAAHPDRTEFKEKVSRGRRTTGMKMGYPTAYDPERRTDHEHLLKGEIVHHRDGNKLNRAPENLLVTSASEHARLHMVERNRDARGRIT